MITLNVHLRQDLGEWVLVAVLEETYGEGMEPVKARAVWQSPLTGFEWDSDPLTAAWSALRRWSDLAIEDRSTNR